MVICDDAAQDFCRRYKLGSMTELMKRFHARESGQAVLQRVGEFVIEDSSRNDHDQAVWTKVNLDFTEDMIVLTPFGRVVHAQNR